MNFNDIYMTLTILFLKLFWDLPDAQVVKTSLFKAEGADLILGQGVKILHTSGAKNQNIRLEKYYSKCNKDFKNGPHQKNIKKKEKRKLLPAYHTPLNNVQIPFIITRPSIN